MNWTQGKIGTKRSWRRGKVCITGKFEDGYHLHLDSGKTVTGFRTPRAAMDYAEEREFWQMNDAALDVLSDSEY